MLLQILGPQISQIGSLGASVRYNVSTRIKSNSLKLISMKKRTILPRLLLAAGLVLAGSAAQAEDVKGNAAAANAKVWLCVGCHSIPEYRADYPLVYKVPMIGGQNAAYIASSLAAYKKGERKHPTMRAIAGSLSDQDMADLGEYYAAQTASSPKNPLK
jgi:cytochrome c553